MYYPPARRALFQPDPGRAHEFTFQQLCRITRTPFEALVRQKVPAKPANCMGPTPKNLPSLVTGLDKDGGCIDTLGAVGLGSIEIGAVTPYPRPGNDRSRLLRLVDAEGLVNRTGFSNLSVDNLVKNVKKARYDGILGIDTGKNKDIPVGQGKDDYLICMKKTHTYTGYIAISISSPNTPGLRVLQYGGALDDLLTVIKDKQNDSRAVYHKYMPITVKIAPDLSEEELIQVADSLIHHNIGGAIVINTTLDRSLVQGMKDCDQTDGLSGRPLQLESTEVIHHLSLELNGRLPIIGVGGIDSVIVARERIAADALLVQIYSGFIFKGPPLVKEVITHI